MNFVRCSDDAVKILAKLRDVTILIGVNLRTWPPHKLFNLTRDYKRRMHAQVHGVCFEVFEVVNTILHTY